MRTLTDERKKSFSHVNNNSTETLAQFTNNGLSCKNSP